MEKRAHAIISNKKTKKHGVAVILPLYSYFSSFTPSRINPLPVAILTRSAILIETIMGAIMIKIHRTLLVFLSILGSQSALYASSSLTDEIQEKKPRHEYVLQLLAHGANPNATVNGCPLIIYITMKLVRKKTADAAKWYQFLQTLLTYKARVDEKDTNLYTALMYAAYYGHYDAVQLLLSYNAHAHYNVHGKTPLSLAQEGRASASEGKQKEYTKIIQLLNRVKIS